MPRRAPTCATGCRAATRRSAPDPCQAERVAKSKMHVGHLLAVQFSRRDVDDGERRQPPSGSPRGRESSGTPASTNGQPAREILGVAAAHARRQGVEHGRDAPLNGSPWQARRSVAAGSPRTIGWRDRATGAGRATVRSAPRSATTSSRASMSCHVGSTSNDSRAAVCARTMSAVEAAVSASLNTNVLPERFTSVLPDRSR